MKACCEIRANLRVLNAGIVICKECHEKHKVFS